MPRASISLRTISARSRASGTSTLFSATNRGRLFKRDAAEIGVVGRQLSFDRLEVADRIAVGFHRRAVDDVHERGAPLDVAQELKTQTAPFTRATNEAGNVGHREPRLPRLHDAEVRDERGERVVGDLRPGGRQRRDQRGLARVRVADERDVSDGLQFEHDILDRAWLAEQREAGRLATRRRQRCVAEAATPTLRDDVGRTRADQVGQHDAVLGLDDRAVGDGQDHVLAVGTIAIAALARLAGRGPPVRGVVKRQQRGGVGVDDERDVAPAATVTAVRTAERLVLLAVDRRATVATVARAGMEDDTVDERRHRVLLAVGPAQS